MTRITRAARTLIRQVQQHYPDITVEHSDLDGLGVYRTSTFSDPDAVEWLSRGDLALTLDQRVQGVDRSEDSFSVTFVPDSRSDRSTPFALDQVVAISESVEEEIENQQDQIEEDEEVYDWLTLRDELRGTPVDELREMYPEYADLKKKDLIESVLGQVADSADGHGGVEPVGGPDDLPSAP